MIRRIGTIVARVLVGVVIVVAVALVGSRVAGVSQFVVLSGSMEPNYPVGSLVFDRPVEPADIEVGDVITFATSNDTVVTHRVVAINGGDSAEAAGDSNGVDADSAGVASADYADSVGVASADYADSALTFTTKGDANSSADASPVAAENVLGTPVICVPYLGYVSQYVQSPVGIVILVALVILVMLL